MPIDYHMHLESDSHYDRCRYDTGRIAVYVDAARLAGLVEIGITEHWHRFSQARPLMSRLMDAPGVHPEVPGWLGRFFTESLDAYVEAVEKAKDEGLPVLLGLEVDYIPGKRRRPASCSTGIPGTLCWGRSITSTHGPSTPRPTTAGPGKTWTKPTPSTSPGWPRPPAAGFSTCWPIPT